MESNKQASTLINHTILLVRSIWSSKYLRIAFSISLGVVSLYLALKDVSLKEVYEVLRLADYRYVLLALLSVTVNTLVKVLRWQVLIGQRGALIKFRSLLMSLLAGQMLNTLYPARIGDISRAYVIGGLGPGRVFILSTVILEKILDLFSYALLFLLLLFSIPLPNWVSESGYTLAGVAFLITLATFFVTYQQHFFVHLIERVFKWMPEHIKTYFFNKFRSALLGLEVLQGPSDLLKLAFWSALIWATALLNNHLTLLAFGIHLPLTASLLILIGLQAGISFTNIPGRFGIFEYICILTLALYGIEQTTALSYGVLLHGIVMLPTTLIGLVFLPMLGTSKKKIIILTDQNAFFNSNHLSDGE